MKLKVYFLRQRGTNLFYKRNRGYGPLWVAIDAASVWTNKQGASVAKGSLTTKQRWMKEDYECDIIEGEVEVHLKEN